MRRTKIICSIGPSSSAPDTIAAMAEAGMDVARFNCSHGDWPSRREQIRAVRSLNDDPARRPAVLLDLAGPKFRLGEIEGGQVTLAPSAAVTLSLQPLAGALPFPLPEVIEAAQLGDTILIGDGAVSLRVESKSGTTLTARVEDEGVVRTRQGVTLVGRDIPIPAITPQDAFDIRAGADEGVDWFAVSFARSAADIETARKLAREAGSNAAICAKIETAQAVERLEEIAQAADAVMVARGDLGLQVPIADVPHIQRQVIRRCREAGKPVVIATQMLESMIENDRPTRAEVSDVSGAILDGADALLLSGETAIGRHPAKVVRTMAQIAERAERELPNAPILASPGRIDSTCAVARAACTLAEALQVAAIVGFTRSGTTARMLAMNRPQAPILAASPEHDTLGHLHLVWGVAPMRAEQGDTIDDLIAAAYRSGVRDGYLHAGDTVVITLGTPFRDRGHTNLIYFGEVTDDGKEA
ncbi:MAG: pyruvate kinase [Fimbriimonadales bacterium]